jgi:alkylation response protein AidB-like acyl-CoA dehydrogenase
MYPLRSPAMPTTPFSPEHEALGNSVRRLVDGSLAQMAADAERGARNHRDGLQRCDDLGLFDLDDVLAEVAAAAELGRLRSTGFVRVVLDTMLTSALGLRPLERWVAVVRSAELSVVDGSATGTLPFVAGGAFATAVVVLDPGAVVDLTDARVETLPDAHALRGAAPAAVTVDAASTPAGAVDAAAVRRWELTLAAAAVGAGWQQWHDAAAYAQQREAFGRPIARFQVNRHALAAMATRLTAAEALVHDVAFALARGHDADPAAAVLYAATTGVEVADRALQLHGGYGYTTDFDVARAWRDARALRIDSRRLHDRLSGARA